MRTALLKVVQVIVPVYGDELDIEVGTILSSRKARMGFSSAVQAEGAMNER